MSGVSPQPARWISALALALVVFAPIPTYLRYHAWPAVGRESLAIAAACLLLGFAVQAIPGARDRTGTALFLGGAIGLFVDIQFRPIDGPGVLAFYLLAGGMVWLLYPHGPKLVALTFGLLLLLNLASPRGSEIESSVESSTNADLPPIVHFILDEHLGLAGMTNDLPGAAGARELVIETYRQRGFRVFENAYSPHFHTRYSVASLMNATDAPGDALEPGARALGELQRSEVMSALARRGYRFRIYQPDGLELCAVANLKLLSCFSYDLWGLEARLTATSGLRARAKTISLSLFERAWISGRLRRTFSAWVGIDRVAAGRDWTDRPGPTVVMPAVSQLRRDLALDGRGTVFLVHLLHPHYPYVYDDDCEVMDESRWMNRGDFGRRRRLNTPSTREERYALYFRQVQCAAHLMADLLDEMDASQDFEDARYVVHGDHGSRITIRDPRSEWENLLSNEDLMDSYSTLLAMKGPEIPAQIEAKPASINREVANFYGVPYTATRARPLWLEPIEDDVQIDLPEPLARIPSVIAD